VTGLGKFAVHKWKWYLVDFRDIRDVKLIRKHFDSKVQADRYNKKFGNKRYHFISGFKALEMGLKDGETYQRHELSRYSKYEFPPGVETQLQKQYYRYCYRRKLRRKKRRPMVKLKDVKEILDQKEVLFFKRLRGYGTYYMAYSNKVKGFDQFRERYDYPYDIVNLSAIYLCLKKHYDCGPFDRAEVAMYIYEYFRERVIKWRCGVDMSHKEEDEVRAEFMARGFIDIGKSDFVKDDNAWVETIFIKPTLVYPEEGWFNHKDAGYLDHSVFELQTLVGIQGYTKAVQIGC
jgi:hypothetical protein